MVKKNQELFDRKYPSIRKTYRNFSTEGFALAVFEELIVCILFCVIAVFTEYEYVWYIWLGGFIACTLHFIIHIGQAIVIRQYIPATITSVMCLPISVWIIVKCLSELSGGVIKLLLFSFIGIVIVALNLRFAQSLIGKFTIWMNTK